MYPLSWQYVYIPVLPSRLLGYLQAPVPFIVGILKSDAMDVPEDVGQIIGPFNSNILQVIAVFLDADYMTGPKIAQGFPSKEKKKLMSRLQKCADVRKSPTDMFGRRKSLKFENETLLGKVGLCFPNGKFIASDSIKRSAIEALPDDFNSNDSIENKRLSWVVADRPKDTLSRQNSIIDTRPASILERMRRSWASVSGTSLKAELNALDVSDKTAVASPESMTKVCKMRAF
jgi:hypothetical protein